MPRRSTREPRNFRSVSLAPQREVAGDAVIYIGECRFLKTDVKPRARILDVFANNSYQIELLRS